MNTISTINSIVTKKTNAPFPSFPTAVSTPLVTSAVNVQCAAMYQNYVITVNNSQGAVRRSTDYGQTYSTVTNANTNFTNAAWRYVSIDQKSSACGKHY